MRFIFTLIIVLAFQTPRCQFYLGLSEKQVRAAVLKGEGGYEITVKYYDNGREQLKWFNSKMRVTEFVLFNKESNLSDVFMVVPKNKDVLNSIITEYNSRYVIRSDTEWRAYLKGTVFKIELSYYNDTYGFWIVAL